MRELKVFLEWSLMTFSKIIYHWQITLWLHICNLEEVKLLDMSPQNYFWGIGIYQSDYLWFRLEISSIKTFATSYVNITKHNTHLHTHRKHYTTVTIILKWRYFIFVRRSGVSILITRLIVDCNRRCTANNVILKLPAVKRY